MLDRSPRHWKHRHFFDPESWRGGATAHRYTVYEADGEVDGYVKWRGKEEWVDGHAAATATVLELMAATPDAERGLWEFMLGLDLTTKVVAGRRATDDGLFMLLANRRRLRRRIHDALWLAIVDVPAALTARRYAIDGEVVIEVTEGFSDGVAGTYRLSGGPDGAECARVDADPDLTLTATELGALYLGGSRLGPMARWGSAAGSAAAMRLVDLMFAWDEVPWCPEVF
jgi:predicted acetyltransferase